VSACSLPDAVAPVYHRHRPERTALYAIVAEYCPQFVQETERSGGHRPQFVRREFEDYLKCGLLEHGFLRVKCDGCPGAQTALESHPLSRDFRAQLQAPVPDRAAARTGQGGFRQAAGPHDPAAPAHICTPLAGQPSLIALVSNEGKTAYVYPAFVVEPSMRLWPKWEPRPGCLSSLRIH